MNQTQICLVPKYIEFQYRNEQQMHCTIELENLVDKVISYKIKSNRPELYLVKPMEGSIYNHQKVKIMFTRKELPKTDFSKYLQNPNQLQQKFLVEINCLKKDMIGRQKNESQSALIVVNFRVMNSSSVKMEPSSRSKKQEEITRLTKQKTEKKSILNSLEEQLERLTKQKMNGDRVLELRDIIILGVVSFLVGFAL